ncbi:MAG TPA: hypothetical protein VFO03_12755 [Gaiellaceae bacterium]|nr:hypothetical protein [Gaiellaceae bacterium]
MSVGTLEHEAATRRAEAVTRTAARGRLWPVALALLFAVAVGYHWLQSLGHETPAVFTDELMFSELARSVAAGDGLAVRGADFHFPALAPVFAQAPVWLLQGTAAYGAAKAVNAVLMCLAVFPAWWLARVVLRPAYAFGVAAASVAGGGMLYHSYLTSEALAYPVFLFTVAASVRAVAEPSRGRDALAVLALALAVLTRMQFLVLPIAFVVVVLAVGRPVRRHAFSLSALAVVGLAGLVGGASLLGFYGGARELDYPALETLRWAGWTAALLPFAAGMLVVPGALLGLGLGIARPRHRGDAALGLMSAILLVALPLEAGLIASGDAHRPMERYAFYAVPLLFAAFFLYLERGAPHRLLYAGLGVTLGGLALVVPFATLALGPFSFDSPTLSAVEAAGRRLGTGNAAALFAAAGLVTALAAAAVPARRFGGAVAAVSVLLALAVGVAAYSGDRRMTDRASAALAPTQKDWLDRTGVHADVLVLPGGSLHSGWMLESWNRNAGATYHLGNVDHDPLPSTEVGVSRDGRVTAGGEPVRARHLVVNDFASRLELDGVRLARPKPGLTLYRTSGPLRLRSLAEGLYADGWGRAVVTYAVWPRRATAGAYRVRLALPAGRRARLVELEAGPIRRAARLAPGRPLDLRIPAAGRPLPALTIRIARADLIDADGAGPRLVGARIRALEFEPRTGSRNR